MLLFISYAHEDVNIVREHVVEILRAARNQPWFDLRIVTGLEWKPQLEQAIEKCDAFVYALTPASLSSEWCQWEFAQARRHGKRILPIMLKRCDLPPTLSALQYADFTRGATGMEVAKMLGDLFWGEDQAISSDDVTDIARSPKGVPPELLFEEEQSQLPMIQSIDSIEDDEKIAVFEQAIYPSAAGLFQQALKEIQQGNPYKAIEAYSRVIEVDSNCLPAYHNRGVLYEEVGRFDLATQDFLMAIQIDDKQAKPYGMLGDIYYTLEHFENSLSCYRSYIDLIDAPPPRFVIDRIEELERIINSY